MSKGNLRFCSSYYRESSRTVITFPMSMAWWNTGRTTFYHLLCSHMALKMIGRKTFSHLLLLGSQVPVSASEAMHCPGVIISCDFPT